MHVNGSDIQVEDGHFARLHNLILDVLSEARFTASEFRVILYLLRKTYGYQKKEDDLSLSQWEDGTNTDRTQVSRTLADLIEKNVIYRTNSPKKFCHRYGFNKYVETWDAAIFGRTEARNTKNIDQEVKINLDPKVKKVENLDPQVNEILTPRSNNKRKSTKERNNRSPSHRKEPDDPESQEWFAALCWLVHGHRDYKLLDKEHRSAIGQTSKQIRASPNKYTLDDLRKWYRDIWAREWPGKQKDKDVVQPPTLKQIKMGIGRTRTSPEDSIVEPATDTAVLAFSVGEFT